jgi:hypothetical protein
MATPPSHPKPPDTVALPGTPEADDEAAEPSLALLERVLRCLEGLADREQIRWYELVRFSLVWALYRRPRPEREQRIAAAHASQTKVARQKEVQAVAMTIAEALKEEAAWMKHAPSRELLCHSRRQCFGSDLCGCAVGRST